MDEIDMSDTKKMPDYTDANEIMTLRLMWKQPALTRDGVAGRLALVPAFSGRTMKEIEGYLSYLTKKGYIDKKGKKWIINESGETKLGPLVEEPIVANDEEVRFS